MGDNCDCEDDCTCGCEDECTCGCEGEYEDGGLDLGYLVVGTLGFLVMGLLLIMTSVLNLNAVADLGLDIGGVGYFLLFMGLIMMLVGAYGIKEGLVAEPIVLILVGLVGFVLSYSQVFGGTPITGSGILCIIIGIGIIIPTLIFFMRREILAGISALLLVVMYLAIPSVTGDIGTYLIGITSLVSGILYFYIALGNTIFVETGEDILPLY